MCVFGERSYGDERMVKKLRLSKALTVPEEMTVSDACRRMAHRMAEAVMLTDSIGLLSGIVSDKVASCFLLSFWLENCFSFFFY